MTFLSTAAEVGKDSHPTCSASCLCFASTLPSDFLADRRRGARRAVGCQGFPAVLIRITESVVWSDTRRRLQRLDLEHHFDTNDWYSAAARGDSADNGSMNVACALWTRGHR